MPTALIWLRDDLRLDDHPALRAAFEGGYRPVPVYLHAPEEEGEGAAANAWRARSLVALDADLRARGSRLLLRSGPTLAALEAAVAECEAEAVFWTRRYTPASEARDRTIKRQLRARGVRAVSFNGALLVEPWDVATRSGDPYRVFTPFWNAVRATWRPRATWTAPRRWPALPDAWASCAIEPLGLAPRPAWDAGFWTRWTPGEAGAREALTNFVANALHDYADGRDRPALRGTSRLSPHLRFGEIAPWRVVEAVEAARDGRNDAHVDAFLRELGWREFAYHLLHHFPHSVERNLNPRFDAFPWADPERAGLRAWQQGRTGVPIVDAGMRELWRTGWMHNRVRMIVASYLCKHMRVHWREGARWFQDTLVDADLANNTLGWQWVAGTGADAAPYFRVFNPVTQARKFDPDGDYIARWVPELAALPVPSKFAPWTDPAALRRHAPDYPIQPIVDLAEGRQAALAAYARLSAPRDGPH